MGPLPLTLLLLLLAEFAPAGNCQCQQICSSSSTGCYGYGIIATACTNGTQINSGTNCYYGGYCDSVLAGESNDLVKVSVQHANPVQCHQYSAEIRREVSNAYNDWCCAGSNFRKCCPGAYNWPSSVPQTSCPAAMPNESTIVYFGARGDSASTEFLLRLQPQLSSELCQLVLSQAAVTTTQAAATAAAETSPAAAAATGAASETTATADASAAAGTSATDVAVTTDAAVAEVTSATGTRRRRRAVSDIIVLSVATVEEMVAGMSIDSAVVSALSSASNGTVQATATVERHVAAAATQTPTGWSNAWIVAAASAGAIAFVLAVGFAVCALVSSESKSSPDTLVLRPLGRRKMHDVA